MLKRGKVQVIFKRCRSMCKLNIGKAIKTLRERNGNTQGDIFRATGLERGYISRLESEKIKYPKLQTIHKIAKFFGLEISEFIKHAEENYDEEETVQ